MPQIQRRQVIDVQFLVQFALARWCGRFRQARESHACVMPNGPQGDGEARRSVRTASIQENEFNQPLLPIVLRDRISKSLSAAHV
jgi:hypothetical protein